ncbi:hypothetical protein PFICI_06174 [Pestalotiopsis fici W106-1]|uniref:Extracellular serine carboxypeptidase n=1 Tax=Pestalotiopsis fici (strain W106-1 / CGMCC3.15140) TaxID=1229662 RepID=W3X6Z6_PESFW|nr:uncharacterized protein PFICI_06174 [Pestalotiopsis fici W106-1]ETS81172.1 hypothetical protein PFICI_06174 [Pestalotiopsis fici W106-1]
MRNAALIFPLLGAVWHQSVLGLFPRMPSIEHLSLEDHQFRRLVDRSDPLSGNGTFEQLINHNDTSVGTFQQSYWYNATFWKGPGSPIILVTPGENAASTYGLFLTDGTLPGMYAKAVGGAVVLIEHRYWGQSSPYQNLTVANLQYLTIDQAIADFVNFAKNVKLPFDTSGATNAPQAPWVWVGGSYAGALAAWIEKLAPGVFWAYHASSAPVQAIYDFWTYFYPIQMGMPRNCSHDYAAIVEHVDDIFLHGSTQEKQELKQMFAVQDLNHDDDAAGAITAPITLWQSITPRTGYSQFYQMCDAIEGAVPGRSRNYSDAGVGLQQALPNFANWYTSKYLPDHCADYGYSDWSGSMNVQCFNSHNTSFQVYHDLSPNHPLGRQWIWMTCNEPFFWSPTGAPPGQPSLFTRLATAENMERQCQEWFPTDQGKHMASVQGRTEVQVNDHTGGWTNTATTRILYSNGEFDPWRSASVSSIFRPGGPLSSSDSAPVIVINGSRHCNDLFDWNVVGISNPAIEAAQQAEISQISDWVADFYSAKSSSSRRE